MNDILNSLIVFLAISICMFFLSSRVKFEKLKITYHESYKFDFNKLFAFFYLLSVIIIIELVGQIYKQKIGMLCILISAIALLTIKNSRNDW